MTIRTFTELEQYVYACFPSSNLYGYPPIACPVQVRFELGEPHANGTDSRIKQVNERAQRILMSCFDQGDELLLLTSSWGLDTVLGDTSPHYLHRLLSNGTAKVIDGRSRIPIETDDSRFTQLLYLGESDTVPLREILAGIANREQGREPSIGQTVVILCQAKGVAFHMYDDRGCIVYGENPDKIRVLFEGLGDWIVQ